MSVQNLAEVLAENDIPVHLWGRTPAKRYSDLAAEVASGEAVIVKLLEGLV